MIKKPILVVLLLLFQLGFSQDILIETQKLAATCKVWGFLKYYHPKVANGEKNWDQQLFDILPEVENAKTKEEFSAIIEKWINNLGEIKVNNAIIPNKKAVYFDKNFDLSWLKNTKLFSRSLSQKLKSIENNRIQGNQYYVNIQIANANAVPLEFINEVKYPDFKWTDKNLRILLFFRYWNYVEYFFPFKYQMDQKWDLTLQEMLPKFSNPESELDFHLNMLELVVKINDSHASFSSKKLFERFGNKFIPAIIKIIDEKAVITDFYNDSIANVNNLKVGDVITKVDGKTIAQLINENKKYARGSNLATQLKNIYWFIFNGNTDTVEIELIRNGISDVKTLNRYLYENLKIEYDETEREKAIILENNIGLIDLNGFELKDLASAMDKLKNTKAIIFDIRNYPEDIRYEISEYLNSEEQEYIKFLDPDLSYPSRYIWREEIYKCGKHNSNYYKGKIILLVNEETLSQAECMVMCLQTAPNVTIVGSQTSGALGGNYFFQIMKGFGSSFTSYGVFYPDKKEVQRIGIIPDIKVNPTILGIQQGKDEVLDRAIKFVNTGK